MMRPGTIHLAAAVYMIRDDLFVLLLRDDGRDMYMDYAR